MQSIGFIQKPIPIAEFTTKLGLNVNWTQINVGLLKISNAIHAYNQCIMGFFNGKVFIVEYLSDLDIDDIYPYEVDIDKIHIEYIDADELSRTVINITGEHPIDIVTTKHIEYGLLCSQLRHLFQC